MEDSDSPIHEIKRKVRFSIESCWPFLLFDFFLLLGFGYICMWWCISCVWLCLIVCLILVLLFEDVLDSTQIFLFCTGCAPDWKWGIELCWGRMVSWKLNNNDNEKSTESIGLISDSLLGRHIYRRIRSRGVEGCVWM